MRSEITLENQLSIFAYKLCFGRGPGEGSIIEVRRSQNNDALRLVLADGRILDIEGTCTLALHDPNEPFGGAAVQLGVEPSAQMLERFEQWLAENGLTETGETLPDSDSIADFIREATWD